MSTRSCRQPRSSIGTEPPPIVGRNAVLEIEASLGAGENAWLTLNSRRLALISKEYEIGLTDAEAAELAVLQDAAAKACEPEDLRLSGRLSACEEQADDPSARTHE